MYYYTKEVAAVSGGTDGTHNYYFEPCLDADEELADTRELVFQYSLYGGTGSGANTGCTLTIRQTILDDGTAAADIADADWIDTSSMVFGEDDGITAAPTATEKDYIADSCHQMTLARFIHFKIVADPVDANTCNWTLRVRLRQRHRKP
jgi:hypothetical protein